MSLKDRLKLNIKDEKPKEVLIKAPISEATFCDKLFEEILKQEINILVYCDINLPTYNAINYLCSKIENDKRLVGIGANLLLNPDEIIKFEPETKNQSKELIKTAISLKPYKIILQDFDGVEAVDIFKLINAGIKNVITAVNAKTPENALNQMELNLYMNGVQIPQNLMKTLIADFVGKIIYVEKADNGIVIKNIFNVGYNENGYKITEITDKPKIVKPEKTDKPKEITKAEETIKTTKMSERNENPILIDVIQNPKKRNILAAKLKRKKINIK